MPRGALGSRARAVEALAATPSDPLDILVVGGGMTGAGIALDAAARGLRTGLVERLDFGSGTSSKSSKLIHGGLRYLEQKEFGLVREASTERDLLGRLAPHLIRPLPFVIPVSDRWRRAVFGVGLWAYDALSSFRNLSIHRHLDAAETEEMLPPLPRGKVRGGYLFYDSLTDDVRLVMEVLVQARRHGALVANYVAVRGLESSDGGWTAAVEDVTSGDVFDIRATRVIIAAGVWTDDLERLTADGASVELRPSKGVHLLFSREKVPIGDAGGFIPDAARERMLFVIPWLGSVLLGTTDTPFEGDLDHPSVDASDRRYCLDALNNAFELDLTEDDILGAYAGLRPLIAGKGGATADLSRRHVLYEIAPGLTGITGGKLTTYRRMAREAVDRACADLGSIPSSKTSWIRLGSSDVEALRVAVARRAKGLGVGNDSVDNLVRCYGDRALAVLEAVAAEDHTDPVVPGRPALAAEAAYCARHEMAVTLADFLARRTRFALTERDAGLGKASKAVEVLGGALGWSRLERRRQAAACREEIERERGLPVDRDGRPADAAPAEGAG